jgi:hypothetical protein
MLRKFVITFFGFLLLLTTVACGSKNTPAPDTESFIVDPVFREFYNYMGGIDILGKVISPVREKDGVKYQYMIAGQMVFDPKAEIIRHFQLGSLGKKFVNIPSGDPGFPIEGPFRELYTKLGGEIFVGKPLTPAIYDEGRKRTEQYFENLGFYQGPETNGEVRLLPYGVWTCDADCRTEEFNNAIPEMPSPTLSDRNYSKPEATVEISGTNSADTTPQPEAAATAEPESQVSAAATKSLAPHQWTLQVSAQELSVSPDQSQKIAVIVNQDGVPYEGALPFLMVELPDKTTRQYDFPPTDEQGKAIVTVDPISAKTRKTIKYQVCLNGESGEIFCVLQSYFIWANP